VATNGFVEIVSDRYVVMTNLAVFQNKVQVTETEDQQPKGGMSCSLLTVRFVGTNQLENMLAETNVVIEQRENDTTNQFVAARAFYTASNNIMELTGAPAWHAGLREGKADLLLVNLQKNTLDARSNAWMRLPASELGESLPGSASKTAPATATAKTNEFADVYSHEYTVSPDSAFFHDEVRILHPSMKWTCEEVSVAFPAGGATNAIPQNAAAQKKISLVADRRVAFVLTDPSSGRKVNGTCDTAYYDYVASAKGTNDVLRLTGNPILTTTNGTVKNKIIILDNTSKKLIAPGKYVIYGTVAGGRTNAFSLPKM
jgi:lipopolysaccharide export system protein LptA